MACPKPCTPHRDVSTTFRDVSRDVLGHFGTFRDAPGRPGTFRDVCRVSGRNHAVCRTGVALANEQLKQALRTAGLEIDDLAVQVKVDVKTAQRWLSGSRTPHPRHRWRVAEALGVTEQQLWPDQTPDHDRAGQDTAGEIIEELTGDEGPDWRELLAGASQRAWLLGLTLGDVITDGDDQLLAAAARRGCRIRVLVSDRDSVHLAIAEQESGHAQSLTNRPPATGELDRVVELLKPLVEQGNLDLRSFIGAGSYQVLIFDDQALVHLRLPGVDPDATPLLHLARQSQDGIFESFTQHFDALWETGEPLK
jgi:transcriptional regulator with XRE-family HTH domain